MKMANIRFDDPGLMDLRLFAFQQEGFHHVLYHRAFVVSIDERDPKLYQEFTKLYRKIKE
jgi:hypothetical protein